jgi:hypothetical protein
MNFTTVRQDLARRMQFRTASPVIPLPRAQGARIRAVRD